MAPTVSNNINSKDVCDGEIANPNLNWSNGVSPFPHKQTHVNKDPSFPINDQCSYSKIIEFLKQRTSKFDHYDYVKTNFEHNNSVVGQMVDASGISEKQSSGWNLNKRKLSSSHQTPKLTKERWNSAKMTRSNSQNRVRNYANNAYPKSMCVHGLENTDVLQENSQLQFRSRNGISKIDKFFEAYRMTKSRDHCATLKEPSKLCTKNELEISTKVSCSELNQSVTHKTIEMENYAIGEQSKMDHFHSKVCRKNKLSFYSKCNLYCRDEDKLRVSGCELHEKEEEKSFDRVLSKIYECEIEQAEKDSMSTILINSHSKLEKSKIVCERGIVQKLELVRTSEQADDMTSSHLAVKSMAAQNENGRLLEILTGEDKSCVIAMVAATYSFLGRTVDIVTSLPVLSQRVAEEWGKCYTELNISASCNVDEIRKGDTSCYACPFLCGTFDYDGDDDDKKHFAETEQDMIVEKYEKERQLISLEPDLKRTHETEKGEIEPSLHANAVASGTSDVKEMLSIDHCGSNMAEFQYEFRQSVQQYQDQLTTIFHQHYHVTHRMTNDDFEEVIRHFNSHGTQSVFDKLQLIKDQWRTTNLYIFNPSPIMNVDEEASRRDEPTSDITLKWPIVPCCIFEDLVKNCEWKVGITLDIEKNICDVVKKTIFNLKESDRSNLLNGKQTAVMKLQANGPERDGDMLRSLMKKWEARNGFLLANKLVTYCLLVSSKMKDYYSSTNDGLLEILTMENCYVVNAMVAATYALSVRTVDIITHSLWEDFDKWRSFYTTLNLSASWNVDKMSDGYFRFKQSIMYCCDEDKWKCSDMDAYPEEEEKSLHQVFEELREKEVGYEKLSIKSIIKNSLTQHMYRDDFKDAIGQEFERIRSSQQKNDINGLSSCLSAVSIALYICEGYFPLNTQLVSWCLLVAREEKDKGRSTNAKGSLLQILTGGGMSCIVAMVAATYAILEKIITSLPMLSKRDVEEWKNSFSVLKLGTGCNVVEKNIKEQLIRLDPAMSGFAYSATASCAGEIKHNGGNMNVATIVDDSKKVLLRQRDKCKDFDSFQETFVTTSVAMEKAQFDEEKNGDGDEVEDDMDSQKLDTELKRTDSLVKLLQSNFEQVSEETSAQYISTPILVLDAQAMHFAEWNIHSVQKSSEFTHSKSKLELDDFDPSISTPELSFINIEARSQIEGKEDMNRAFDKKVFAVTDFGSCVSERTNNESDGNSSQDKDESIESNNQSERFSNGCCEADLEKVKKSMVHSTGLARNDGMAEMQNQECRSDTTFSLKQASSLVTIRIRKARGSYRLINLVFFVMCHLLISAVAASVETNGTVRQLSVMAGQSVRLQCSVTYPDPVTWRHAPVETGNPNVVYLADLGILGFYRSRGRHSIEDGTNNLMIKSVTDSDAGKYMCEDKELEEPVDVYDILILKSAPSFKSNIILTDVIGENDCGIDPDLLRLQCSVDYHGNFAPVLQWQNSRGQSAMIGTHVLAHIRDGNNNSTESTLTVTANMRLNDTYFICQVADSQSDGIVPECRTEKITVHSLRNSSVTLEINMKSEKEISCSTNSSLPCNYQWTHQSMKYNIVILGSTLNFPDVPFSFGDGIYECQAECRLRRQICLTMPRRITVVAGGMNNSGKTALEIALIIIVLVMFIVAVAAVFLCICRRCNVIRRAQKHNRNGIPVPLILMH